MIEAIPPNHTGWHSGVFYISGAASKKLVAWAELRGLLKFPTWAHRNHCIGQGAKPESVFDQLPDEPAEETNKESNG